MSEGRFCVLRVGRWCCLTGTYGLLGSRLREPLDLSLECFNLALQISQEQEDRGIGGHATVTTPALLQRMPDPAPGLEVGKPGIL